MSEYLGAWLRQQREVRSWTKREMARQLIQAGRSTGDTSLPGMDSMCHNIHRWERGQGGLTERYKLHYCNTFGIPPDQFGADPAVSQPSAPAPVSADLTDPRLPIPLAVAYRGRQDPQMGDFVVEREVLMAAHEGSEHAEQAERRDIGEATLEQLHADVARLSVESMTGEPFPLFREMRRVRARIYRLLDGILRPADQADLYFLLGCLSDLMAVVASGLGYPQAAEELIVVYVGHPGVRRDLPGNLVHIPGGRDAGADVDDLPDARLADQEPHGPLLGRPYANCLHSQS